MLDKDEPTRKARKAPGPKDDLTKKTQPNQVAKGGDEEAEMTKRVTHIGQCLKESTQKKRNHSLWEFVIDTESYSRTVENLFHFSFLLKDGHAKIEKEDDKIVVGTAQPPLNTQSNDPNFHVNQSIVRLDFNSFQDMSSVLKTFIPALFIEEEETNGGGSSQSGAKVKPTSKRKAVRDDSSDEDAPKTTKKRKKG